MSTLTISRGNDRTFRVTALDELNQPADLTDAHLWFTAKISPSDTDDDALIRKDSNDGVSVMDDPVDGIAEISLVAADTADLPSVNGRRGRVLSWDLKLLDSEDKLTTLASGILVIVANITRQSVP